VTDSGGMEWKKSLPAFVQLAAFVQFPEEYGPITAMFEMEGYLRVAQGDRQYVVYEDGRYALLGSRRDWWRHFRT